MQFIEKLKNNENVKKAIKEVKEKIKTLPEEKKAQGNHHIIVACILFVNLVAAVIQLSCSVPILSSSCNQYTTQSNLSFNAEVLPA